ncbi:hypothetical protein GALMADRAFT_265084 [Galerina marginata CBS 339.88]|uniref:Uncharacterized protein n=1 Tax=Galerina marginata (strain CBS 339.88) TaxID=685588 RepID=A0A067TIS8_GALM3|nr:hypothetical protein GALMADRAFT_265084 [Galerina marginata CBS 339.88]
MSGVDRSPTTEFLPAYVQHQVPQSAFDALLTRIAICARDPNARVILESFIESQKAPAYNSSQKSEPPKPIEHYPIGTDPLTVVKQQVVAELFRAIQREDSETIAFLIQNNLVTANTTNPVGRTPLLEAISTKIIHLVKELLDFGADPDAFGVAQYDRKATRTPLMFAASLGSLPIVKLLFEPPYSANDALVAPDGQIALRLASAAGHRLIVEYLPSRRVGGFLRWKTQNAPAIARMKGALRSIRTFIKFFVWYLPKFFVWDAPKHLVVLPVVKGCKWSWANRKKFGGWCKHQITETPKRFVRAAKRVWNGVKKVPKAIWKFGTQTVPRWVKKSAIWFRELITVRIPKAIVITAKWIWSGLSSLGKAIWGAILKGVSFLHTVLQAIVTFLRNVTMKDIWNGFCDLLRAIFITFPATLWSWIRRFGVASFEVMKTLFGWFGELLWWIVVGLEWLVFYIPAKLWIILQSLGGSIGRGWSEFVIWINPKA